MNQYERVLLPLGMAILAFTLLLWVASLVYKSIKLNLSGARIGSAPVPFDINCAEIAAQYVQTIIKDDIPLTIKVQMINEYDNKIKKLLILKNKSGITKEKLIELALNDIHKPTGLF